MRLSSYCYLFNARLREFDLDGMVTNFTTFFDETVVATIPSQDDTYERLLEWQRKLGWDRFRVVMTDIDITKSNRWDGDLKTAALRDCCPSDSYHPRCYVIMDGDERVNADLRPVWDLAALHLMDADGIDGILVPVIDLMRDEQHCRKQVGVKFRLHKDTVVKRGVIPDAERANGLFDTSRSDSTEPLLANGQLARFVPIGSHLPIYVFHYGHLDAERRARLNREFWLQHWRNRSGEEPSMALEADQLASEEVMPHGLKLP